MNIEQARMIPLALILEKIGYSPIQVKPHRSIYLSPLRAERTPSFHVHNLKNLWYDHGTGRGGSVIGFACAYLESQREACLVPDALRWLKNMTGSVPNLIPSRTVDCTKEEAKLILRDKKKIEHPALMQYLDKRGIPLKIGQQYLKEVRVLNTETNKTFFALGMPNEDEGYEIRNPFFKGSVGHKSITFIRGTKPKPEGINLFEGSFDYLSIAAERGGERFEDDCIILHSLSCLKKATPYIQNYGYRIAYAWLDNDKAGESATNILGEFCKTQDCLQHRPMNAIYAPHKDLNAWRMAKLGLSL
ncbi:MAG: toprim domain-containing protein [Williamsia sp.]|nr:toprim domain-containing protein [Williamsia sp.]